MKGEDLTVLEQTTQLTHKRFYYVVATPTITLKNITSEVKFAESNGSRLYYKTIACEKKFRLLFSLTR